MSMKIENNLDYHDKIRQILFRLQKCFCFGFSLECAVNSSAELGNETIP